MQAPPNVKKASSPAYLFTDLIITLFSCQNNTLLGHLSENMSYSHSVLLPVISHISSSGILFLTVLAQKPPKAFLRGFLLVFYASIFFTNMALSAVPK